MAGKACVTSWRHTWPPPRPCASSTATRAPWAAAAAAAARPAGPAPITSTSRRSVIGVHPHALAHGYHARALLWPAVDIDAAFETHSHAAQRGPAPAVQRAPERLARPRDGGGHADAVRHLPRLAVDHHRERFHATTRAGSKGRASRAGSRPSRPSTSNRAVAGAVHTPWPSWPAATQMPRRAGTRPM